jgi:hypothetical protein
MPPHPGVAPASGRLTCGGSEAMSGAPVWFARADRLARKLTLWLDNEP